jgi:hypothetical protein
MNCYRWLTDTKEGTEGKNLPKWSLSLQCFQTISIRSSETDSDWTIHNNVPSKRQRLKDICSSVCAVSVVYKQSNVTCMLIIFVFILCHQLQVGFSYLSHIIEHLFSELLLQTLPMLQKKKKINRYVGESHIIRTIGTCFAVGYTIGWAWQNTQGLLLSYHCGAGVTLIVHFCHKFFCHKHGHTQFHLHQRRAEGSDLFLWAEGVPGVEMHRMMTVQYGNSVKSQWIVC